MYKITEIQGDTLGIIFLMVGLVVGASVGYFLAPVDYNEANPSIAGDGIPNQTQTIESQGNNWFLGFGLSLIAIIMSGYNYRRISGLTRRMKKFS